MFGHVVLTCNRRVFSVNCENIGGKPINVFNVAFSETSAAAQSVEQEFFGTRIYLTLLV